MFNRTKRISVALAGALFIGLIGMPAATVSAAGGVKLNASNFPDKAFRTALAGYDVNHNGSLSSSEIKNIRYLYLSNKGISSLKGIDKISEVTSLYCAKNKLTSLDVSHNKKLSYLDCSDNKLTSVKLGDASSITSINCSNNPIRSFDISGTKKLASFTCNNSKLEKLKVGNLPALQSVNCANNKLKTLDLSGCKALTTVSCSNNVLTELKLPSSDVLRSLSCSNNKLTELDVAKLISLTSLNCSGNKIKSLDVTTCKKLMILYCYKNGMKYLDLGKNRELLMVACNNNKLSGLDVSGLSKLMILVCNDNNLTELDVKDLTSLSTLSCFGNKFDTTEISVAAKEKFSIISAIDSKVLETAAEAAIASDPQTAVIEIVKEVDSGTVSDTPFKKPTWNTSDPDTVTIEPKADKTTSGGILTGVMAGNVTVKYTLDGKTMKFKVRVLYKDVTDPEDFWFEPTNELTKSGVVKGYEKQTMFEPSNKCTRAQMVTFLWRLEGCPKPKAKTCKFPDVKKSDYFYKAVIWGSENNIVEGYGNGTFKPQVVCARKHAVTFMWRLAGKPDPASDKNVFKDIKTSDYFYKAALWASEMKILAGYSDKTFRPDGACLRRQMVTFLYKYDKNINGK